MITRVIIAVQVSLLIAITGCGGGGGGGGGGSIPNDIIGVWDASENSGQTVDEYYSVIKSNGTVIDYDYLGDSFDQGPNCYLKDQYSITSLGSNKYELDYGDGDKEIWTVTENNDTLTVSHDTFGTFNFPRASLQESDFSPIC